MKYTFNVPDMSCNHCKMRITEALEKTDSINSFTVNVDEKKVIVDAEKSSDEIIAIIDQAGYDAELI